MFPNDSLSNWASGKGIWSDVSDDDWNDWRWQMRNRLQKKGDFEKFIQLTDDEIEGFKIAENKLSVAVTPYFFNQIDRKHPDCPLRRQVMPSGMEALHSEDEMLDPVGEESSMAAPGIVHRYPDRVLFLVTDRCAAYCRYCTRSRLVSNAQGYGFHPQIDQSIQYIASNDNIRDVLISGGDPLMLSDQKLETLLSRLSEIPHVEFVRFGSRVPVFLPQRITSSLINALHAHQNVWMSIHVNHPKECTQELRDACHRLTSSGIPLGNQSVLLKGINDDDSTMKQLIHRLLIMKVKPYYLYQCDLVKGSSHLRVDPSVGINIIKNLRGHTTGYAIPQFVIDAPEGGGKIPINPNYVSDITDEYFLLKNFEGKPFRYPRVLKSQ
jgi:lysine 2,3-aminomutase